MKNYEYQMTTQILPYDGPLKCPPGDGWRLIGQHLVVTYVGKTVNHPDKNMTFQQTVYDSETPNNSIQLVWEREKQYEGEAASW